MIRADQIVIRVAKGMKPGRTMAIKGTEIIYESQRPTMELMSILLTTPDAVAFVAPDVQRALHKQITQNERAKANAVSNEKD